MEQPISLRGVDIRANGWKNTRPELKLLLVNGNRFYAEGLRAILNKAESSEVSGQIICNLEPDKLLKLAEPDQLRQYYRGADFDLVLLAVDGTNFGLTLQTALWLRENWPTRPVIWLDVPEDSRKIISCIGSGACGFVMQADEPESLLEALSRAGQGQPFCPARALPYLFSHLVLVENATLPALPVGEGVNFELTRREGEVLAGLVKGWNNRQIALELSIEVRTVKNHVHNILRKLQVRNRYEAVVVAVHFQLTGE